MDKLAAIKAFTVVVAHGGFAAAAREMGQSRSAVNRLVIQLEEHLGAQLLNRTTRAVSPTATGLAYHEKALGILASVDEAEHMVTQATEDPGGTLRINAPMTFGIRHLAPAIADFLAQHPNLHIQLSLNDRFVDLIAEGFDVTVRISQPQEDTTLVDHRLANIRAVLCASPDYLKKNGVPKHPSDLENHACLHYGHTTGPQQWRLVGPEKTVAVRVSGPLCSNNGDVLYQAALKGLGIAILPTFITGADLQHGRLVSILPEYGLPELTLCVVYPATRHPPPALLRFTDFLEERFSGKPYWDLTI